MAQDSGNVQQSQLDGTRRRPHIEVEFDLEVHDNHATSSKLSRGDEEIKLKDSEKKSPSKSHTLMLKIWMKLTSHFQWVFPNNTWSKWKPVIRCALAAWIGAIIFVVPASEKAMGQASFLILIAGFLSPPSDPFIAVLERELIIMFFVTITWAWSCLGIKLADLARKNRNPSASPALVVTGQYIEVAPSIILATFVFFGSGALLFVKAKQGPGPFLFACVFGCICLDINLTTAALFPYPYYQIGQAIAVPLAIHSAIALAVSILVFPLSVSASFTSRLQAAYEPLISSLELHRSLLRTPTDSNDFSPKAINAAVNQAEGALVQLAAAARLLKADVLYNRFAPSDYAEIHQLARRMVVRANGMTIFFTLIDPTRERFPVTPAPSQPQSLAETPMTSRPSSPDRSRTLHSGNSNPIDSHTESPVHRRRHPKLYNESHSRSHQPQRRSSHHGHSHSHSLHHILLHDSLLHLASHHQTPEQVVGVFESHRYLNLESTRFSDPNSVRLSAQSTRLLNESVDELISQCTTTLKGINEWMGQVRHGRWDFWVNPEEKVNRTKEKIQKYEEMKGELETVLTRFRNDKRHKVLDPYRAAFDPEYSASTSKDELPAHRYLFNSFVYQFHLIRFTVLLVETLTEITRLERLRKEAKLWTPAEPVSKLLSWGNWEASEHMETVDDEDPDIIQGVAPQWLDDLGMPRRRDPDALPPSNLFEALMNIGYNSALALRGGNTLFAIKAAVLTVLLCLPSFFKSTASFAYEHKSVWAVFMGQLTIARFRGDTAFGFTTRIISTFFGVIVGLVMWYISSGTGHGNPYGLAVVFAVAFPFFFFVRLYWPGPPMTNLIFFVTSALVVGYSYQDTHLALPSSPGWGFSVAWRRFVLVSIGVFGAFVFSFFPPSTTIRYYQRATLSTSSGELGAIYCSIISFANAQEKEGPMLQHIVQSLIAIRSKLKRSLVLRTNVIYEFSLRGKWPSERYYKIFEIQVQAAFLLSHLLCVVQHLEPAWAHAFLRRTRLLDSDFQGDVLAVVTMLSNSLRSGEPLPQITPCPLVERFLSRPHGFDVIHQESEDDYGLPRRLTFDTLKDEQYMMFSVGVATVFAIITRLDRLMVATKNLTGEQYHIQGVGFRVKKHGGIEMGSRTNSLRPAKDV